MKSSMPMILVVMNPIDLFADTAAIFISIVSTTYYGMPRGQIHINLPPEHPIMSFETIEIKMAAVSVKRSILANAWRSLKNLGLQQGFNPWPRDPRVMLKPTELWNHWWSKSMQTMNCVHSCENDSYHIRSSEYGSLHMSFHCWFIHHGNIWTQKWPAPNISGFIG